MDAIKIMVAGIGTEVGKTVVSAILAMICQGDYWKPIQCGDEPLDASQMREWLDPCRHFVFPPVYSFRAPLSPHHAARLEDRKVDIDAIFLPQTKRALIIEGVGGIFVPLTNTTLTIDLFASWNCHWVVVSKHYLGSINHTLLTIEALKKRHVPILGLIFNGAPNLDTEDAIIEISQLPVLGRLLPESNINPETLLRYALAWQRNFMHLQN